MTTARLSGFSHNIGKQTEPFIIPPSEYRGYALTARVGFYNLDGELLDILEPRTTYGVTGIDVTDTMLDTELIVVIDLKDPEVYDYLRELKDIQKEPFYLKPSGARVESVTIH